MIKKLLIILLFTITPMIQAQDFEFGKVSKEDLLESTYEKDSSANAVILYKSQKTYFEASGGIIVNTDVHMRIKFFNKEGFEHATQVINLFKSRSTKERVGKISGITYNLENGAIQKSKLDKEQVFKNEFSYNIDQVKFTMPNVKEGSIIEFMYTTKSPFFSNIDELVFQYDIPIKKLDVEVRTPKVLKFKNTHKGFVYFTPTKRTKIDQRLGLEVEIETYKLKDVPALLEENYAGNINNYRSGVMLELVATDLPGQYYQSFANSWEDVASTIGNSDDYKKQLSKNKAFDDQIDEVIAGKGTSLEKLNVIFDFVKKEIKWNGNDGKYFQKGMKKALEEHLGSSGDINLTLVAMLRYAGIEANPVVISTKDNGVPFFPTVDRLNYVVAYAIIDDNTYFLDATNEFSEIDLMPSKNYNWRGLYINNNKNSYYIKNIKKPKQAVAQYQLTAVVETDGSLSGSVKSRLNNHYAFQFRENYKKHNESDFIAMREDYFFDIEVSDYNLKNVEKVEGNVQESFNFTKDDAVEVIGNDIYIEPLLLFKIEENPFKLEERLYPIDFEFPRKDLFIVSLQIPEGYKVKTNVEAISMKTPSENAKFVFGSRVVGNTIQLTCNIEIINSVISPTNYAFIKQFYSQIISKGAEKIVLTKA